MAKNDPLRILDENVEEIRKSVKRWNDIRLGGSQDPFWPDGVNMNLVRNHIIYYRRNICEMCEKYGMIPPEEAEYELPPKVSECLWLRETDGATFDRISHFHNLVIPDEPLPEYIPFKEGQLSLF